MIGLLSSFAPSCGISSSSCSGCLPDFFYSPSLSFYFLLAATLFLICENLGRCTLAACLTAATEVHVSVPLWPELCPAVGNWQLGRA